VALARFKKACLDTLGPDRLGRFWADVLGLEWRPYPNGEGGVFGAAERPVLWINRVPEGKTVKHRVHLDVYAADPAALTELGARVIRWEGDGGIRWTVLADPEGGEFCAFRPPAEPAVLPAHRQRSLVVDCADPVAQAIWWGRVLGVAANHYNGFSSLREVPGMPFESLDFVPVPEPKAAKNRIHWDLAVDDPGTLLEAGASVLRMPGGDVRWHVLADPEGNEFCAFTEPEVG
jgi:Glyoxalase-like domain